VAAHELRTPITSVAGYTRMLRRELSDRRDPERIERYAIRLDEAGIRLNALAEDLLDVSRIRSGLAPLRVGPVSLTDLATRVATRYAEHRSSARERIRLTCDDDPAMANADPDRVEQVLTNLIDNALKYSPPNTEIDISTAHRDRWVRVAVKDRGIGVDPAHLETIFQPFGRAANAESSGIPGMGLGLYICRTIVERLGGQIWAESAGQDAGLTVIVQLPIAAPGSGTTNPE
jgi:signal transduction histidine kinase